VVLTLRVNLPPANNFGGDYLGIAICTHSRLIKQRVFLPYSYYYSSGSFFFVAALRAQQPNSMRTLTSTLDVDCEFAFSYRDLMLADKAVDFRIQNTI